MPEYGLPPWLSTDNGSSYGQNLARGMELGQRRKQQQFEQGIQSQRLQMEQQEWKQKQQQYQQQAQMLAQTALREQEYQKAMADIQAKAQSGALNPQQLQTAVALANLKRASGTGASTGAELKALGGPSMPQPFSIPGVNGGPSIPGVSTGGKASFPPAGLVYPKPVTPPVPAPPPTSIKAIPVLDSDGKPMGDVYGVPTPKGIVIHNRPKPPKSAAVNAPKATDINKYHKAQRDLMENAAILKNPTRLTAWALQHADGDEDQAKDTINDKLEAAQENIDALEAAYSDYDWKKPASASPATAPITATNPKTGQKLQLLNGRWQPIQP